MKKKITAERHWFLRAVLFAIRNHFQPPLVDIPRSLLARVMRRLTETYPEIGYQFNTRYDFEAQFFDDLSALAENRRLYSWRRNRSPRIHYLGIPCELLEGFQEAWQRASDIEKEQIRSIIAEEILKTPPSYFTRSLARV